MRPQRSVGASSARSPQGGQTPQGHKVLRTLTFNAPSKGQASKVVLYGAWLYYALRIVGLLGATPFLGWFEAIALVLAGSLAATGAKPKWPGLALVGLVLFTWHAGEAEQKRQANPPQPPRQERQRPQSQGLQYAPKGWSAPVPHPNCQGRVFTHEVTLENGIVYLVLPAKEGPVYYHRIGQDRCRMNATVKNDVYPAPDQFFGRILPNGELNVPKTANVITKR